MRADLIVFLGMATLAVIYGVVQVHVLRNAVGPARWIAAVPLLAIGGWSAFILVSVLHDPTAHNLWPFEIVLLTIGGLLYLGVLSAVRGARRSST
jgi:uncharacterized PurR-regulated membrane protein YhhQ (DUF165 family)